MYYISAFLEIRKVADFRWKNDDVSRSQECVTWCIYFLEGISVPSFIIVGYMWQIFGRRVFLSFHSWAARKRPILDGIKINCGSCEMTACYSVVRELDNFVSKKNCSYFRNSQINQKSLAISNKSLASINIISID